MILTVLSASSVIQRWTKSNFFLWSWYLHLYHPLPNGIWIFGSGYCEGLRQMHVWRSESHYGKKGKSHYIDFLCTLYFFSHSIEYMRIVGIETESSRLRLLFSELMSVISEKLFSTAFPELCFYWFADINLWSYCRYDIPLVADIHFAPAVALRVAEAFEKIR